MSEVERCNRSLRQLRRDEMTVFNYRRDGTVFKVRVIMLPIRGGLTSSAGLQQICILLIWN